jgi:hypothetical protein
MTDLSTFTPGEVIAVAEKWSDTYTYEAPAVFLGIDRGLAVVAWPTGPINNPFLFDGDEQPYLRRATWEPRRIRKTRITGTYADYKARLAAERDEDARKKAEAEDLDARKAAAFRSLSAALDALPGVSSYTFGARGDVRIFGDPDAIEAAATAIAGLGVTA